MSKDILTSDRITSFNQTPIVSSPRLDQNETEYSDLNSLSGRFRGVDFEMPAFEKEHSFGVRNEPNNIYKFDRWQPMANISSAEVNNEV